MMINKNARFGSYYKDYHVLTFLESFCVCGQLGKVAL